MFYYLLDFRTFYIYFCLVNLEADLFVIYFLCFLLFLYIKICENENGFLLLLLEGNLYFILGHYKDKNVVLVAIFKDLKDLKMYYFEVFTFFLFRCAFTTHFGLAKLHEL